MFDMAEILRKFENLFRLGTVAEIDGALARVLVDDVQTAFMPWICARAGNDRAWRPLSIGEQVLIVSPGGDTARGIIIGSLYQDAAPPPETDGNVYNFTFSDGAVVTYDKAAHRLSGVLPEGGTAYLETPGGTTIKGPLHVDGPTTCTQTIQADGDITSGGDVADATSSMQDMRDINNVHGHPALNTPPTEKME